MDPNVIATYFGMFEDLDDRDHISKIVNGDESEKIVYFVSYFYFFSVNY